MSSQPRNTQKLGKLFSDLLSCGLPGSGTDLAADSAAALDSPLVGRQLLGVVVTAFPSQTALNAVAQGRQTSHFEHRAARELKDQFVFQNNLIPAFLCCGSGDSFL